MIFYIVIPSFCIGLGTGILFPLLDININKNSLKVQSYKDGFDEGYDIGYEMGKQDSKPLINKSDK